MAEILSPRLLGRAVFAANVAAPLSQFLGGGLTTLFFAQPRRIATLVPGVVIEENGTDTLEVTQHPVERGAPITDHSYMLPAELVVRCAWGATTYGQPYLRAVYAALRALQASREPFAVSTGKRLYENMLMRTLNVGTSGPGDENLLSVTCTFQEVIIAETQEATLAPREQQTQAHNTAPPVSGGSVTPVPAPEVTLAHRL